MSKIYKIGTRDSLLAMTQCGQVRDQLEKITGQKFELFPLKTQGDLNTSVPLWQLEGENFFTKELDTALIEKKVDLVVHSYKDLGSIRPTPLTLAAVTKRSYANDLLLIKKETILENKKTLIIGTSSPRRVTNIEDSLSDFIPGSPSIKCETIRGNVNSRIKKLQDGLYDAIVLAHAGIERLAIDPTAEKELIPLLSGLQFMILPQSIFPSAASQGALAIECLKERKDIIELVQSVHHLDTAEEISRERQAFNHYGGGCHLAVGIRIQKIDNLFIHTHRGKTEEQIQLRFVEGRELPSPPETNAFIGMNDTIIKKIPTITNPTIVSSSKVVTSRYCLPWLKANYQNEFLWSAGSSTMKKIAAQGYWVNGSMDSMGEEELSHLLESKAISLLMGCDSSISSLSHDSASSILGKTIGCYSHEIDHSALSKEIKDNILFYWTSFKQFKEYEKALAGFQKEAIHCCGLGKTYKRFKEENIPVIPFSGIEEFNRWRNHE